MAIKGARNLDEQKWRIRNKQLLEVVGDEGMAKDGVMCEPINRGKLIEDIIKMRWV